MRRLKIVVEEHPDGFIAYPLGLAGVVVGQGDSYEEALADAKSAIAFHLVHRLRSSVRAIGNLT